MDLRDLNAQTAPHHIRYSQVTPLGLTAKSKKVKYMPQNGNGPFTQNNNLCRIPVSSATAFEDGTLSYMKYTYTNRSGRNAMFDNSAHSTIRSLRFTSKHGGQDLEFCPRYDQTHAALSDLQLSLNERFSRRHEGYGLNGFYTPAIVAQAAGGVVAVQPAVAASTANNIGTGEITLADGASCTVCLPLMSSLFGADQKKYLPLFLTGEIMMEIVFQSGTILDNAAAAAGRASDFEISNVEFHAEMIEFDASVNNALTAMAKETGIFIHGTSWSTHYNALPAGVKNIVISERLRSVKTVLFHFNKPPADRRERSLARSHNGLTAYKVKVGSEYYPSNDVRGVASDQLSNSEFLVETYKAIGEFNNTMHSGLINCENFANDGNTFGDVGRSVYGMDLDSFQKAQIEAGVNMVNNNPMIIEFESPAAAAIDSYTHLLYDCLYVLKPSGEFVVLKA